jgi:hypothetical protein
MVQRQSKITFQKLALLVFILSLILCGCHPSRGGLNSCGYQDPNKCEFILDQLYFGLETPNGEVSKEEWKLFVKDVIMKRFPDGFTVIDGYGQWRDKNGKIIEEKTKVVEIAHENNFEKNSNVKEIIEEYKTKFFQESVLRVTSCSRVRF